MTKQARILKALENMINEFGQLKTEGIVADCQYRHVTELNKALWSAYREQEKIVAKQK